MREVGLREGWLPKIGATSEDAINLALVRPFVEWHLIVRRPKRERDFYPSFLEEMEEIFGQRYVQDQLPVASGSTLKIDFHIGHPQRGGVGVEIKMPANNSDIQRALGQLDQYQARYLDQLLVVVLPDMLNKAQLTLFTETLTAKGVTAVIK